ncbi:MAG: hypothetical protein WCI04_05750 [archaeon]
MAHENSISILFTSAEWTIVDDAIDAINGVIIGKMISLTPDERQENAKVGIRTEDWIGRVKDYMGQNPELVLQHIDLDEYIKDFVARKDITPRQRKLAIILSLFDDTNLLLGADLWHNSITYYKGVKAFAQTDAPGARVIYDDLKRHFPGRPSVANNPPQENT